ncbi:MAG: VWA domain-containing protein [Planctomycetes bacterium]|nr:VWA domain-containing protein [Planctomycetota bacterium]
MVWPFASGSLLWWGLAAAIPVALHLWNRRRYQEHSWAAMAFLLAAMRKNARRLRLEQLLLLLLRVAILLLLATALAEPVLRGPTEPGTGAQPSGGTQHLIVLDASYSMAARRGDRTLFEWAQQEAIQLVRDARAGDGFLLMLMSDPPRSLIGRGTFDTSAVVDEIVRAAVIDGGADWGSSLAEMERLLRDAREQMPTLTRQRITLYTDLGKTTWRDVGRDDLRARLEQLDRHAELHLRQLAPDRNDNRAITRMELRDAQRTVGDTATIEVEARNFGANASGELAIELWIDGEPRGRQALELPAGSAGTVTFQARLDVAGEHALRVVIPDDVLATDNQRWLSLPIRESLRLLCVEGTPNEARLLRWALEPLRGDGGRARVDRAGPEMLLEADLRGYDGLFLCNVSQFTKEEGQALARYLRHGGGIVIFAGDQAQPSNYNRVLAEAGDDRVSPVRFGTAESLTEPGLDPGDYSHPLTIAFRGQERSGLLTTPVWRFMPLELVDPQTGRVALRTVNGGVIAADEQIGDGHCLVFGTAVSTSSIDRTTDPATPWTALPTWPSFVPLVQESLALIVRPDGRSRNWEVGAALYGMLGSPDEQEIYFRGPIDDDGAWPGGERLRVELERDRWTWRRQGVDRRGLYRVEGGTDRAWWQWHAVNIDAVESDLAALAYDELPESLRRGGPSDLDTKSGGEPRPGRPLFQALLLAVASLMLVESHLAAHWGSRGRTQR